MNNPLLSKLLSAYKTSLLLSLVLAVVTIAFRLEVNVLNIGAILLGFPLGMILLEMDYFLFAYLIQPEHHFSQMLKSLVKDKNWPGLITYLVDGKSEVSGSVLRSAFFQIVILGISLFSTMSRVGLFSSCFVLGMSAQLLSEQYRLWKEKKPLDDWFWNINMVLNSRSLSIYFGVVGAVLAYCFYLLVTLK